MKTKRWVLAALLCVMNQMALAWDGMVTGKVILMEVTHGTNFGVRVTLDNGAPACTGGPSWAYLNEADSNYKVYVATFLTAKAMGTPVTIYSTKENNFCHIGHLASN